MSNNSELVSVIVPVFNGGNSISRCIDSILSQTYVQVELIVVDDGSTDDTLEILSHYSGKIKLIRQGNKGPAAARNHGLAQSCGEYIAFLDSDDYWMPSFLVKCVTVLRKLPDAVAVSTGTKALHWSGKEIILPILSGKKEAFEGGRIIHNFFEFWGRKDHIRTGNVVINMSTLPDFVYQREDLWISEDLEFWGTLATYGNWAFLPEVLFVTDGTRVAASIGWLKKNRGRRRRCPTVEQWQKRIVQRLKDQDWPGFKIMRGRVAGNFAHAKILAGDYTSSREIVRKFGQNFKVSQITWLLNKGDKKGWLNWRICCFLVRLRERLKAIFVFLKYSLKR